MPASLTFDGSEAIETNAVGVVVATTVFRDVVVVRTAVLAALVDVVIPVADVTVVITATEPEHAA